MMAPGVPVRERACDGVDVRCELRKYEGGRSRGNSRSAVQRRGVPTCRNSVSQPPRPDPWDPRGSRRDSSLNGVIDAVKSVSQHSLATLALTRCRNAPVLPARSQPVSDHVDAHVQYRRDPQGLGGHRHRVYRLHVGLGRAGRRWHRAEGCCLSAGVRMLPSTTSDQRLALLALFYSSDSQQLS